MSDEQQTTPAVVKLKVISPDGVLMPGIGWRPVGGIFELDAKLAAQLVEQYPSLFEEVK